MVDEIETKQQSILIKGCSRSNGLRWCETRLSDIISAGKRLEASVFDPDGIYARNLVENSQYPIIHITGKDGMADAYTCNRFKRIWLDKSALPIYQPATISDVFPEPAGYLSKTTETDIDALRVHKNQILLTCSGTIGNVTLVSNTLDNQIFSHDLIRITCHDENSVGYLFTYLKSKIGNKILLTNEYGSVVSHIEASHLDSIPIPNIPDTIKKELNNLIQNEFKLIDEANSLIKDATDVLKKELNFGEFDSEIEKLTNSLISFSVKLSEINLRFDAAYHQPYHKKLVQHVTAHAKEISHLGDSSITKAIFQPNRFKRIYVDEEHGIPFFGGKNIHQLVPTDMKFLSPSQYNNKLIQELLLKKDMIVISRSGTIGKIALVPKHWLGWAMSDDIIRVVPNADIAGYIYIWLNSRYGRELLASSSYGAVICHIEVDHVASVIIPRLKNTEIETKINDMANLANEKCYEAYLLEQKALEILNTQLMKVNRNEDQKKHCCVNY